jgi:hypothetical protein
MCVPMLLLMWVFTFMALAQIDPTDPRYELSRQIEGFAGAYFDSEGVFTIAIVAGDASNDPEFMPQAFKLPDTELSNVKEALSVAFKDDPFIGPFTNELSAQSGLPIQQLRVVTAKYSYQQLAEWLAQLPSVLRNETNLGSFGMAEDKNKLIIGIKGTEYDVTRRRFQDKLTQAKIPTAAVIFIAEGEEQSSSGGGGTPTLTLNSRVRPLQSGTQITLASRLCSIGYTAYVSGTYGIITANHCTGLPNLTNISVYQPSSSDFIGTVTGIGRTIAFNGTSCNSPNQTPCLPVDAIFIAAGTGVQLVPGAMADVALRSKTLSSNGYTRYVGAATPSIGLRVYVVGQNSGKQIGVISELSNSNTGAYFDGTTQQYYVTGRVVVTLDAGYSTMLGDSGGIYYAIGVDGRNYLLGTHTTRFTPVTGQPIRTTFAPTSRIHLILGGSPSY